MSLFISLTPDMNDETLLTKVERGNVGIFTVVYSKYHRLLYVLAYRCLMDKVMAGDTVQRASTHFWEFRSELRIGINLRNYPVATTRNHILNAIRSENNAITKNYEITQSIPEYEDTLIENLEKKEMVPLFYKASGKLLPQKCETCPMKVCDEFTNPEIAEHVQLSVNTIKTHYLEALKLLHAHLHKLLIFATYLTLLKYLSILFILWTIRR